MEFKTIKIDKDLLIILILLPLIGLLGLNQYLIHLINIEVGETPKVELNSQGNTNQETNIVQQIYDEVVPKERKQTDYSISFSTSGMNTLVGYYRSIELVGDKQEKFINVGTQQDTGCEYCCGIGDGQAITIDGKSRCGCAHHLALIGLMKYLVQEGYSNEQILSEIQKWKAYFFPKGYVSEVLQERGVNPESVGLPAQRGGC